MRVGPNRTLLLQKCDSTRSSIEFVREFLCRYFSLAQIIQAFIDMIESLEDFKRDDVFQLSTLDEGWESSEPGTA